jgi:hypothetical protein
MPDRSVQSSCRPDRENENGSRRRSRDSGRGRPPMVGSSGELFSAPRGNSMTPARPNVCALKHITRGRDQKKDRYRRACGRDLRRNTAPLENSLLLEGTKLQQRHTRRCVVRSYCRQGAPGAFHTEVNMGRLLVILAWCLAFSSANALAADFWPDHPMLMAQTTTGTAGPVAAPGSNMSKPRAFPSSSGAGVPETDLSLDDAYSTAIRDCESLPSSQRKVCVDDINKRYGQM